MLRGTGGQVPGYGLASTGVRLGWAGVRLGWAGVQPPLPIYGTPEISNVESTPQNGPKYVSDIFVRQYVFCVYPFFFVRRMRFRTELSRLAEGLYLSAGCIS